MTTTERPILFSGPMVRALLREVNPKTQTRRVVKPIPHNHKDGTLSFTRSHGDWLRCREDQFLDFFDHDCPHGVPGDRLWVRETWSAPHKYDSFPPRLVPCGTNYHYAATEERGGLLWRPSIHMPRWASRITLEIIGVRVERLRDISENDAKAEGVTLSGGWNADGTNYGVNYTGAFSHLWDSINGNRSGYAWADNPWVFVIEFKRIEP